MPIPQIEMMPLAALKPHPRNPRQHPEKAIDKLVRSLREFGWTNPVLLSADGFVLAGHARLKAAEKAGIGEVPVIRLPLSGAKADAYLIADNRLQDETEWDIPGLKDLLEDLDSGEFDLRLTGFDLAEIEQMMTAAYDPQAVVEDEPPEPPEVAIAKPGEIWQLGRHRIMCGDGTDAIDVGRLLAGRKADMVFTDPPYNVSYGESKNPKHKIREIRNDKQSLDEWASFNARLAAILKDICPGDIYVWGASGPDGMRQRLALVDAGAHWSATIVWKKQQLVLSPANYQRMYEPAFYGWFGKSSFVADRKQTEVWEFDRPTTSKLHPTMKPVALCAYGIQNSCQPGEMVLDLFLGSGSTLIAAEQTGRTSYGMEIEPKYIDVVIQRWEQFTGKKAELLEAPA